MDCRYITILTPEDVSEDHIKEEGDTSGVDLRTLRAIRVLRPLKLVSGVPSESVPRLVYIEDVAMTSSGGS